jgi:hypothetical protein
VIIHETKAKKLTRVLLKLDFEKVYDWVNWGFLCEVLPRKGFDLGWVHWEYRLVSGRGRGLRLFPLIGRLEKNHA